MKERNKNVINLENQIEEMKKLLNEKEEQINLVTAEFEKRKMVQDRMYKNMSKNKTS